MKQQIKSRYTGAVLFECDVPNDVQASGLAMRHALEQAVKASTNLARANLAGAYLAGAYLADANLASTNLARANLAGAYLAGAYLADANLASTNLARANLARANLADANLADANLAGAYLAGANLAGAYLAGAYLARANLEDANLAGANKLIGKRPVFMVGPIGSRNDYFQSFITEKGLLVSAGCFQQKTINEFRAQLSSTHQDNDHAKEYEMALLMVEAHAAIWTPKEEK